VWDHPPAVLLTTVSAVLGLAVGTVLDPVARAMRRQSPDDRPGFRSPPGVVRAGCALLFGACAWRFGASWALPAYLLLFAALLVVSVIDLESYRIPNRILIPATITAIPLLGLAALGQGHPGDFLRALAGGVAAFGALLVMAIISPRGMGMGDVKLAFLLGLHLGYLGWGEVALGLFAGFLLGAVIGLGLIISGRRSRKDAVPFGPFLAAGTVVAVLWGEPILRWYGGA
jgi:leader peptidase (prepilin peptidase) / N-methyltransferase